MATATRLDKVTPYRRNEKVVATTDLGTVPEGTTGKIKVVNGMTWLRYWVQFDNGEWLGSIDHAALVPAREWEQYRADRARRAEQGEAGAAEAGAGAGAGDGGAASAGGGGADVVTASGVTVPGHLIERARKARERLGKA